MREGIFHATAQSRKALPRFLATSSLRRCAFAGDIFC